MIRLLSRGVSLGILLALTASASAQPVDPYSGQPQYAPQPGYQPQP